MGIFDKLTQPTLRDPEFSSNGHAAEPASYDTPRGIVAAATRINLKSRGEILALADRPYAYWQNDAWDYHDSIGEINYSHEMMAAVMSRLRLYAAIAVDPDAPPTSTTQLKRRIEDLNEQERERDERQQVDLSEHLTPEVTEFMELCVRELGSGWGGIAGLLRAFTINMAVPGECYLTYIDNRWSIRSTSEVRIRQTDGVPLLREARLAHGVNGSFERELPTNTYLARIWRPHGRWSKEPTSSMIALSEPCEELLTLQRMVRGIARSRMNAGLLFLPDTLSLAGSSVSEDIEETEDETEQLVAELFYAMTTPINDEAARYGISPMVVTGPEDVGEKIKYFTFERKTDEWLLRRLDGSLARILNGLNFPKELVAGLDNVRYTNANTVTDQLYRVHVEPLAVMLCDALTSVYLRPRVKKKFPHLPSDVLSKIVLWYDPTDVVIEPDPATAATSGYDKHILSADAWRHAHGYSEADAPSQMELALRLVYEQMARNLPPETQQLILQNTLPALFKGESAATPSPLKPQSNTEAERQYGSDDAITSQMSDDESTIEPGEE